MDHKFDRIHIEIGNACNLQCSFCPEVIRDKKLMSFGVFQRVLSQVAPHTREVCFHLMGEPLMHRLLPEFLDEAQRLSTPVNLTTNGVLLVGDKIEQLLHPALRQVNFSLQSYLDNFPNQDPTAYLQRIVDFTRRAFELRPDLYINYRFWNLQTQLSDVLQARNAELIEFIERELQVTVPRQIDLKFRKGRHLRGRLYAHFDSRFDWPSFELPQLGSQGTCKALQNHIGVLVDGTVVPCCLDKEGQLPLGNLLEADLSTILTGPRTTKMLAGFRRGQLVEKLCQHCNYIQRFDAQAKRMRSKTNQPEPATERA